MTKKEALLKEWEEVKEQGNDIRITLFIHMPSGETEIIINPKVAEKIEYIKKTYTDELVHSACNDIYIEGYEFERHRDHLSFGKALEEVKKGKGMRLPQWKEDVVIRVQYPDERSKMTAPYLYVESRFGRVPWKETMIELFSEDWQLVE